MSEADECTLKKSADKERWEMKDEKKNEKNRGDFKSRTKNRNAAPSKSFMTELLSLQITTIPFFFFLFNYYYYYFSFCL